MQASNLLTQAQQIYDDPALPFASQAQSQGWKQGFTSGADWMRCVMSYYRGTDIPYRQVNFQLYGFFKYGLASIGALTVLGWIVWTGWWMLTPLVVITFYIIEAQMVFLFPLLIDACHHPIRESRQWMIDAGGTCHVMSTVMQLAVVMLFGGFIGRGFVRSWALGCLSVCIWYEELRHAQARII